MESTAQLINETFVLSVHTDRLDGTKGVELKERIGELAELGYGRIVIDLSEVRMMDSTALGALVSSLKSIGRQGDLSVAGLQDGVATLFKLTRMDKVFRIHRSVAGAVEVDIAKATGT
jgi:anti-sigma B factor antagonist